MSLAPIVLFVYNRPWHTEQTLTALQNNYLAQDSVLYIYADGPKNNTMNEQHQQITEVRKLIKQNWKFKEIHIMERIENWGLADNVVDGVTTIVNQHGKIIVLEDDIVTSPYFLKFMNDSLEYYEKKHVVMHIGAHVPPICSFGLAETFFYNQTSCWGWATWKNRWFFFKTDALKLQDALNNINFNPSHFNIENSQCFTEQLSKNIDGSLKTWAIKWYTSVYLMSGLCLHPNISLVRNIGFDSSGTNCGEDTKELGIQAVAQKAISIKKISLKESTLARKRIGRFNRDETFNQEIRRLARRKIIALVSFLGIKDALKKIIKQRRP